MQLYTLHGTRSRECVRGARAVRQVGASRRVTFGRCYGGRGLQYSGPCKALGRQGVFLLQRDVSGNNA